MLRPASPLSVLLFIAFVLLLISVISTPIVKGIPLATFEGVDYGVFGFCKGNQCSGIKVGYTTANNASFTLPSTTRHSLSAILIVHPIAALLTLICFILAATAHLHAPSHSPRFLTALLVLLLPTLLITLLAFLVDILLFVPHLQWGGWIVLASTILILASGLVTCAMRRTLVSRKARKKRIAENAEMNGDNFYARQNALKTDEPLTHGPTPPMVNGAPGADKLPAFATFDINKNGRTSEDDQTPLNQQSVSNRTAPNSASGYATGMSDDGMDRYTGPTRGGPEGIRGGRGGRPYNGPRDEFGNPLPPSAAFGSGPAGPRRNSGDSRLRQQYSGETLNSQGSRGRGRGGYPPRGYGRGGPYGGGRGGPQGINGNGRGIPLGAIAGGAGAGVLGMDTMGRGQTGPPPGYSNGYPPPGRNGGGQFDHDRPGPYGREPSPGPPSAPGYGRQRSPGPPSAPGYRRQRSPGPPSAPGYGRQRSPGPPSAPGYGYSGHEPSPGPSGGQIYQRNSPPPPLPLDHSEGVPGIGQAVEMDASTGSPSQTPGFAPNHHFRESDSDVQGLVGLQQNRFVNPQRHDESPMSPSSVYSGPPDQYIAPRAAWVGGIGRNNTPPLNTNNHPLSPVHPVELSAGPSPPTQYRQLQPAPPTHTRNTSADNYYEDVDPRFAESEPPQTQSSNTIPSLLMPGHLGDAQPLHPLQNPLNSQKPNFEPDRLNDARGNLGDPSSSFESIPEGARSPAASEASHFTSVSQRGVNPDWRPPPGQGLGYGIVPNRRPVQQQRDVILAGNPDFELPGVSRGGFGRGGGGGGGYPTHAI